MSFDVKHWLQSKTIWGILITASGAATMLFGFDVKASLDDVEVIAGAATTIIGSVLAIVGRVKARKKIGS